MGFSRRLSRYLGRRLRRKETRRVAAQTPARRLCDLSLTPLRRRARSNLSNRWMIQANLVNFLAIVGFRSLIWPFGLISAHQNLAVSGVVGRAGGPLALHALDERGGAFKADAEPSLHVAG